MLKIENLHRSVGDKPILKGLTLDVPAGEGDAANGPDGAGMCYVEGRRTP
jgi:Fe-S cluster assembly ATP-binding protein